MPPPSDTCGRPSTPATVAALAALFFLASSAAAAAPKAAAKKPSRTRTAVPTATSTMTPTHSETGTETATGTPTTPPAAAEATATVAGAGERPYLEVPEIVVTGALNTPIPHILLPEVSGGMMQLMRADVPDLSCDECGAWSQPPTVADGEGGFITVRVVHTEFGGGRDTLYAQRVSAEGEEKWSGFGVQVHAIQCARESVACIRGVSLCADGFGGAIVVFSVPGNGYDAVAQRLDHFGKSVWKDAVVPVCEEVGDQQRALAGADGRGGAFVAWQDFRKGEGVGDLYVQHLDAAGRPSWQKNGVSLFPWLRDQYAVSLRPDGNGGVWATWYDYAGKRYNLWSVHLGERGQALTKKPFWWLDQW